MSRNENSTVTDIRLCAHQLPVCGYLLTCLSSVCTNAKSFQRLQLNLTTLTFLEKRDTTEGRNNATLIRGGLSPPHKLLQCQHNFGAAAEVVLIKNIINALIGSRRKRRLIRHDSYTYIFPKLKKTFFLY